ncbi:hypothetical protein I3679_021245 [Proteus mirabilis]|uniref:Uncharacterized protein n=1 Tax=Proteus mirabilis TaxID=584 RepID=A0ABD5M0F6_PROMI
MDLISRLTTNTTRADFALAHQQQLIQLLIQHFPAKYHTLFATPQKPQKILLNGMVNYPVSQWH